MNTLVMKYGGTSVGSPEASKQAAAIVREYSMTAAGLVVVVSAMSGVTDLLLKCAHAAARGDNEELSNAMEDIRAKHQNVVDVMFEDSCEIFYLQQMIEEKLRELKSICRSLSVLGEITPRGLDAISSLGERMNARVFSALLRQLQVESQAVDATRLIETDSVFQNAIPKQPETREKCRAVLLPMWEEGQVPVVTGFIAADANGVTTTLGRGGSDYTAAILGAALDVDEVLTWTDVDGVMTADPRVVDMARVISELSFAEVRELAYFGAKVLHPKTIRPILERDIPLWVKNTFNPSYPGTRITKNGSEVKNKITAVTTVDDLSFMEVEGLGMMGEPGIAARMFSAVARTGAAILMISQASSEQSICFTVLNTHAVKVKSALEEELRLELERKDIAEIRSHDNMVNLTVIGNDMRSTPGISSRIFGALGKENINVSAIAQGSSDYSLSIVIGKEYAEEAVRAIHREVIENGGLDETENTSWDPGRYGSCRAEVHSILAGPSLV